ncbi:MAG: HAD hydrolase-like protein [Cyclobacteriaceae bacterium]|nr:HAD hydrolase-like protein [Cyclobacteriaceae bacterium]
MAAQLQLIVFDLAGTTVNDNQDVARILKLTLAEYNVSISLDDAARLMGIPKPEAIKLLLSENQHDDKLITEIHTRFVTRMQAFYTDDPSVVEKKDASFVFAELRKAGIKVAVDTGFDRAITRPLLERMGWMKNGLVIASVTSDEVPCGRPHPDMIFKAMELTGVTESHRVGKVGDTASDLQSGTAAGCGLVVGITTGAYSEEELSRHPHHKLIKSLPELLPIIGL